MPNLNFIFTLFSVFLAIFVKFWEPGLGVSSATYGALANNLLNDHKWFHLNMEPSPYSPFVDQPYLVIWLDAIIFKLLGASAQTIRLLSSISGVFIFAAMYSVCRKQFDEMTAILSCICLLTVNIFMNFTSSGWLDMPTIALVWGGFYFVFWGTKKERLFLKLIGSLIAGASILAKGVCAIAILPAFIWFAVQKENRKHIVITLLAGLLPLVVFTYFHYQSEGFLFWLKYFEREGLIQNNLHQQTTGFLNFFWYPIRMFGVGHIVTVLGLLGCKKLFSSHRDFSLLVIGQILAHSLLYSISSRHYPQYVIHVFPWVSVSAGFFIRKYITITEKKLALSIMSLMIFLFVLLDLLPIRIHSGNENPFRAFTPTLSILRDNKNTYFVADLENQLTWEDLSSYIYWYWDRKPIISSIENMFNKMNSEDTQALGVMYTKDYLSSPKESLDRFQNVTVCLWNDVITIFANKNLCTLEVKSFRPRELPTQTFER